MEASAPLESFCQRVVVAASIRPDKVAMTIIEVDGQETVTFGSMLAQLRSIAYRLTQEGIAFGDRVALIGENHPNWAIAYLGIIYRGAVVAPMDPAATTQALDECGAAFTGLILHIVALAQEEIAVARLSAAMRKTTKLLNALQKVVLPRIERDIRAIVDGIEEDERDESVRRRQSLSVDSAAHMAR